MKIKHLHVVLLAIFFVVASLSLFIFKKVSANTLTETVTTTTRNIENTTAPITNPVLQKPILTVSIQTVQIVMKVSAPGALIVTINVANERGEMTVYRPILTPEGTWFLSLPIAASAPGTYTTYATSDSGNGIFGQSNIVSYSVKAPETPAITAPTNSTATSSNTTSPTTVSPTSGTSNSNALPRQSEVTIKDISGAVTDTTGAITSTINSGVPDSTTSQSTAETTTLPEKFAKTADEIQSTKIIDPGVANSPVIESIKNIEISAVEQGTTNTAKKAAIVFSGKAKPNSTIYLYIFSDPIIVSVKADENGNWQYILDRPLDTGKHESYVLIEDPDTKEVLRTEAKSFFISKARATSSMMDIPGNKGIILEDPFTAMVRDYGVYVGIIIGLAVLAVLFFGMRKYRKAEVNESDLIAKNE